MLLFVDQPVAGAICDPLCLRVEGWAEPAPPGTELQVEAFLEGNPLGGTGLRFVRPDVNQACGWPEAARAGFALLGHAAVGPFGTEATLRVQIRQGAEIVARLERQIRLIATDHRHGPFGILLRQDFPPINHREHVYTSGPSHPSGSLEMLELLVRYLGPPPRRIVDIGCGLGWYGGHLLNRGFDWHGAEMKAGDCAALAAAGLPHTQIGGSGLPFPDAAFDAAIAVEVLEHVREPDAFIREAARVAPQILMLSVPNAELLAYLSAHRVVPWHMLEADHCNFFTRASLGALLRDHYRDVEVGVYSEHPLRTAEGTALHYHLYAVARHAR
jgi:SAM-dependent methyltransferase